MQMMMTKLLTNCGLILKDNVYLKTNELYTYLVFSNVVCPTSKNLQRLNCCSFHRADGYIFVFCTHFAPDLPYNFFINSFSFVTNNISLPQERKVESSLEIPSPLNVFFHLYSKHTQSERTAEVINYQDQTQTFFLNLILCTERTSYARDISYK